MALIVTPRQLNQRAELYHQLGTMLTAGLPLPKALEELRNHPPSITMRGHIARWLENVEKGFTVTESIEQMGKWASSFDLALIDAGEQSGRLDACLKLLALYYREKAQLARQMISDMLYPAFLFNFAVVIFAFVNFMKPSGTLAGFATTVLCILTPIYAGAFLIVYACQGKHGESWRGKIENILRKIPILGAARRHLALARLSMALESLLNAGVPIVTAWELASKASGSPELARVVAPWRNSVENGSNYSELLSASGRFPDLFTNLYHTGEVSGTLDQTLNRLHTLYQTEGMAKMKAVSTWTPKLIYFGVLLFAAYKIVSFYAGYFREIGQAGGF